MLIESRLVVSSLFISAVILFLAGLAAFVGKLEAFERRVEWWRRQKPLKRIAVVAVLIGVVAYAGTKPDSGGGDDAGGPSTNDVTQVEGDANNTNDVGWIDGNLDGANDVGQADGDTNLVGGVILNAPRPMSSGNQLLRGCGALGTARPTETPGFSLVSVGRDETFDFSPPEGAAVATNWLLHGSSTQPIRLPLGDWLFPFGDENHSNITVFASGEVMPGEVSTNSFLKPFAASLGIVPVANWSLLPTNFNSVIRLFGDSVVSPASLFWHELTPSNTLLLTWQNALLGREATNPVSFQAELKPSGGFTFRYDLSRLASDELLTNVTVGVCDGRAGSPCPPQSSSNECPFVCDCGGAGRAALPGRSLTSLTFASADGRRCDEFREKFDAKLRGEDPFAVPEGSTNTVLEHVFYSGTTNGAFASPQSTDDDAVLMVTVSGHGSGELMVGSTFVPLVGRPAPVSAPRLFAAPPPSPSTLAVTVPRGSTQRVYLRGDSTLTVSFDSSDFAFGELPDLSGRHFTGWINFPNVRATVPCIHDYSTRRKLVSLPVGSGADELTCEWHGTDKISVENLAPRSALVTGSFSGRTTTPVTYTLAHPKRLFGQATHSQTARFCPRPNDDDEEDDDADDDDDDDDDDDGRGDDDGDGEGDDSPEVPDFYDGFSDDDDPALDCWCCFWGSCRAGCGCGCSCYAGETGGDDAGGDGEGGGGEDGEGEADDGDPSADPDEDPTEDPEPDDYDVASVAFPHLRDVLKVRAAPLPLEYTAPIRLTVPDEHRNCCPCPDHASNFVAVAYRSSRLKVTDADGVDFSRSGESLDVRIAAVRPSARVGDACVSFAANGDVCLEGRYTAVGVGIERDGASSDGLPDLQAYTAFNPDFGLPMTAATNLESALRLALLTNVRLPFGNVHLGFEGSNATFAAWVCDPDTGAYRKLADGSRPLDLSLSNWRKRVGKASDSDSPRTPIRVTASAAGPATLVFRYWGVTDEGAFVEDEVRQPITAVNPLVTGDVSHDGRIDGTDADLQIAGRLFRFWYNEDVDKGDYVGQVADSRRNGDDAVVNGKYDLVNLFPLKLDVTDFIRAWGNAARFRLRSEIGGIRFCILDGLSPQDVAAMQTESVRTADEGVLESAELTELDVAGTSLSEVLTADIPTAMLAFEASGPVSEWSAPELVVSLGDQDVFSYRIPLSITSVDRMYRYLNLRGAESGDTFAPDMPSEPGNLPDAETDDKNYVFVHGYNVNASQSRAWARAMFKRLWWAGLKSKFTAVDWFGDDSQLPVPIVGDVSPNYYINVEHAFMTAEALKNACDALPGEKVMLAHSLGNMLVSAAAKDFNLQYSKYYMLNAAVPMEAYDENAHNDLMIDGAWNNLDERFRASHFSDLFISQPSDFRIDLSWRGRFAGIPDAVNCYSTTEDILKNPSVVKVFGLEVAETTGGIWSKQELFKGCSLWYGVNSITFAGTRIEGGWGINANFVANPLAYIPMIGFVPLYFSNYTRADLIATPLFTSFNDERMSSTNNLNVVDYALRAKMLGDAIPAESFAAGRNATGGLAGNYDFQSQAAAGWPKKSGDDNVWEHSDIKNVAYFFAHATFEKIKNNE